MSSSELVEEIETSSGTPFKRYAAEYKLAIPRNDGPIGAGELGELSNDDEPCF